MNAHRMVQVGAIVLAIVAIGTQGAGAQSPTVPATPIPATPIPATPPAAPTVFYETTGDRHHRLYRVILDGVHQAELVADRPAIFAPESFDRYTVSPHGRLAIVWERGRQDPYGDSAAPILRAIPLTTEGEAWTAPARPGWSTFLWSDDGAWLVAMGGAPSLIDAATGALRDLRLPRDRHVIGFEHGSHRLILAEEVASDSGGRRHAQIEAWDPLTRIPTPIGVPGPEVVETAWPADLSVPLGLSIEGYSERPVTVMTLADGATVEVPGQPDLEGTRLDWVSFDATGRRVLSLRRRRDESGVSEREDLSLYASPLDGPATAIWQGPGSGLTDEGLVPSVEGDYLLLKPHYGLPDLALVALDGSGNLTIPGPGSVVSVTPVRIIGGVSLPGEPVVVEPPIEPDFIAPGTPIAGAPRLVMTAMEETVDGGEIGRVTIVMPTESGTPATLATTIVPLGQLGSVDFQVLQRPGSDDFLIDVRSWRNASHRAWHWTPGGEPTPQPLPRLFHQARAAVWSPDGRWLASIVGRNRTHVAVFDEQLALRLKVPLPPLWDGASIAGWAADSRRIVLRPPTHAYGSTLTTAHAVRYGSDVEPHPACDNVMSFATLDARTRAFVAHRSTRELKLRFTGLYQARAATGEWVTELDNYRMAFESGCGKAIRSPIEVISGTQTIRPQWSVDGRTLYVVTKRGPGQRRTNVLIFQRPYARPDQAPASVRVQGEILDLYGVAPGGGWAIVRGESNQGCSDATGLLDLATGAIQWTETCGGASGWLPAASSGTP